MALVRQVNSGQSPFRPAIVLTERSVSELHGYLYALDLAVWDRAYTYIYEYVLFWLQNAYNLQVHIKHVQIFNVSNESSFQENRAMQ